MADGGFGGGQCQFGLDHSQNGSCALGTVLGRVGKQHQKDAALQFVNYVTSPEGQARLATSACYWGMPANAKAADVLTADQKAILRWDQQPEYLSRSQLYPVPDAALDTAMQDLWTEMLQN